MRKIHAHYILVSSIYLILLFLTGLLLLDGIDSVIDIELVGLIVPYIYILAPLWFILITVIFITTLTTIRYRQLRADVNKDTKKDK